MVKGKFLLFFKTNFASSAGVGWLTLSFNALLACDVAGVVTDSMIVVYVHKLPTDGRRIIRNNQLHTYTLLAKRNWKHGSCGVFNKVHIFWGVYHASG